MKFPILYPQGRRAVALALLLVAAVGFPSADSARPGPAGSVPASRRSVASPLVESLNFRVADAGKVSASLPPPVQRTRGFLQLQDGSGSLGEQFEAGRYFAAKIDESGA